MEIQALESVTRSSEQDPGLIEFIAFEFFFFNFHLKGGAGRGLFTFPKCLELGTGLKARDWNSR